MRAMTLGTCLMVMLIGAAPASAQVTDIRGLTFDVSMALELHGNVLDQSLHGIQPLTALEPVAWTFDVLPDADSPKDPARIVIRTRLPTGPDTIDPLRFELHGTYDRETGAISASGVCEGCHDWQTPFESDAFGLLDRPESVWVSVRDPKMTLNAIAVVPAADTTVLAFDILGGSAIAPKMEAAVLELNASLVAWMPAGVTDLAEASLGPYLYTEVTCSITALQGGLFGVFGDMNEDAMLTQADVIAIHKLYGPRLDRDTKGDLTADGFVDAQDGALLQWLVRSIGIEDVVIGGPLGIAGASLKTAGLEPVTLP